MRLSARASGGRLGPAEPISGLPADLRNQVLSLDICTQSLCYAAMPTSRPWRHDEAFKTAVPLTQFFFFYPTELFNLARGFDISLLPDKNTALFNGRAIQSSHF